MRIDDALFYAVLDSMIDLGDLDSWCTTAASCGVDIIEAYDIECFERIREVCRRDEIIAVCPLIPGARVSESGAVIVDAGELSVGMARGMVGAGTLTGVRTADLNELILAVETGCDFALYTGNSSAHDVFASVRRPGVPLFAGGAETLDDVAATISSGVFRVAVGARLLGDGAELSHRAAGISRLLGRDV